MQEAGFVNLLRTLLIIILLYYAFKFLMRLLAPYILNKVANKMQEKAQQQFNQQQKSTEVKEGETIIDKKPNLSKTSKTDVGEYVDFEEID